MKSIAGWLLILIPASVLLAWPANEKLSAIRPIGADCKAPADAPRFKKLEDFYFDTNPELAKRLDFIKKAVAGKEKHFGTTHLVAPGGAGKSFLFGSFSKQMADQIYKVDLTKLAGKPGFMRQVVDLHPMQTSEPELCSTMAAFGKPGDPATMQNCPPLTELFKLAGSDIVGNPRPILLIDSLDEIHPLSATSVLQRVEQQLKDEEQRRPNGFAHVFVFGRPEAFMGYYLSQPMQKKDSLVEMRFPRYVSMKDLEVAIESSRAFYKRTEKDAQAVVALATRYPFIVESVHLLHLQGALVNESGRRFIDDKADERKMKDVLVQKTLERNRAVMNRPTLEQDYYARILEEIAARYTDVDADGFFRVESRDSVEVPCQVKGQTVKRAFNVANTLDRSGLVYLDPGDFKKLRYRFVPSWIHEHLVYRQSERAKESRP